jgi:hypothetical protein
MSMTDHDLNDWGIDLVETITAIVDGTTKVGDVPPVYLFAEQSDFKRAWNECDIEEVIPPLKEALVLNDQQIDWLEEYFAELTD